MPAYDVSLQAFWNPIPTYKVSYDGNEHDGGSIPLDNTLYVEGTLVTILADLPTKTGYTFGGWSDGSNTYQAGETFVMPAYDMTLQAVWNPIPAYKVNYDGNGHDGGSVPLDNNLYITNTSVTILSDLPTKTGYTFSGWSDGTNIYQAGEIFVMPAYDITLQAIWTPIITYKVSYDGNGQGVSFIPQDNETYYEGDTVNVSNQIPICEGYIFGGWNTKADGTGILYQKDTTFIIKSNVTLYAMWHTEVEDINKDNDQKTLVQTGSSSLILLLGILLVFLGYIIILISSIIKARTIRK